MIHNYILGIDQGGSKTVAAIADIHGNILGVGKSGGGSHYASGMSAAMSLIKDAVNAAAVNSGLKNPDLIAVYAGLSGADFENEYTMLTHHLKRTLNCEHVHVVNDCIIAMRTGITRRAGAILCAGTGLNCAVRNDCGEEFIFGYYIEDRYQGGQALGLQVLTAVFNAEAALCAETMLTGMVLAHFSIDNVDDLLKAYVLKAFDPDKLKTLTYILDECAEAGDAVSLGIFKNFGHAWFRYFEAGLKKLDMTNPTLELVISGGVFKCKNPTMLNTIKELAAQRFPNVQITEAKLEPVAGAVMLCLDSLAEDMILDAEVLRNVQDSCERHLLVRKPKYK